MRADSQHRRPAVPAQGPWVNVATLRMDQQRGKPVLVEFWDFCRVNSLRTLPYLKAWHERYAEPGCGSSACTPAGSARRARPTCAARSSGWRSRGRSPSTPTSKSGTSTATRAGPRATCGTATRAVLDALRRGRLPETERRSRRCSASARTGRAGAPGGRAGALIATQTEDVPGVYGARRGGASGRPGRRGRPARQRAGDRRPEPGCVALLEHGRHTQATLSLEAGPGVEIHATCCTPGLA